MHPTEGLQNGSVYSTNIATPKTVFFDITFTYASYALSRVFGGTCEKYIPLSVLKGLEVWIQLENVKNCLKYQFIPSPSNTGSGVYGTALEALNKVDSVARMGKKTVTGEGSSLKSTTPTNYFYNHSILSNIGTACTETFKFSPGNITWSDALPSTDSTNYFS